MGFLSRFIKAKPGSKAYKLEMAEKFNNLIIDSATERIDNEEILIGKKGSISIKDKTFIVCCEGKTVFHGRADEINVSELMSKNGIIISGYDDEREEDRTIVAHFSYYRKL
ncbi:MAG: hypothetical protein E7582_01685 [Ruminococcaceae bacterium]|nr:hypothetical protein [Oscillospiraceae bacterium]